MLSSRFREDKCLVNFDVCEYFSGYFRSGHLMISEDGCSENEEGLFGVVSDSFLLRGSMVFIWSALSSSNFISIVASISDLAASILLPPLFLAIIFSRRSSKDVVSDEIFFSFSINMLLFYSLCCRYLCVSSFWEFPGFPSDTCFVSQNPCFLR